MEEKALYEKFEQLLKEFNIRPYAVAKKANISQPTLSDWKLGKSEPKRITLEKICRAYGKDISYFYGGQNKESSVKIDVIDQQTVKVEVQTPKEEAIQMFVDVAKGETVTAEDILSLCDVLQRISNGEGRKYSDG